MVLGQLNMAQAASAGICYDHVSQYTPCQGAYIECDLSTNECTGFERKCGVNYDLDGGSMLGMFSWKKVFMTASMGYDVDAYSYPLGVHTIIAAFPGLVWTGWYNIITNSVGEFVVADAGTWSLCPLGPEGE